MKKKVLLSSILTIALCLSLIAGSTFALFTSESKVNVAVTSGKVNVVATVSNLSYTSTLGEKLAESDATVVENVVTIVNMVPGDEVDFDIVISNNSNVTIQYRTVIKKLTDDGLWEGLIVTIGENTYNGVANYAPWESLSPDSADKTVHVKVALPKTAGNEYQEKSCSFAYTVEAVQGNAEVKNPTAVSTEEDIRAAAQAGEDISLNTDIALTGALTLADGITVYGNGNTISGYPIWAGKNTTIKDVVFADPTNVSANHSDNDASNLYCGGSINIDGCTFKGSQWDCVLLTPSAGDEIIINNCTFVDSKQRFIHIEAKPTFTENDVKITLTNNKFGDDGELTNSTIDLDFVKLDSINFGGNNVFANVPKDIYVCADSYMRTITSEEAFKKMGAVGVASMPTGAVSGNYTLTDNISGTANNTSNTLSGSKTGFVMNNGVLNGNGNTLSVGRADVGIEVAEGSIKNITVSNAFRGIMTYNTTGTINIDNVTVTDCGYAINTGSGTNATGALVVTNSTLGGWSSWAGLSSADFTNCTFVKGSYFNSDIFDQYLRPYATSTFENCDFAEGMHFDLSKLVEGATVTFKNCTCNGVTLTADNVFEYIHLYLDNTDTEPTSAADLAGKLIFG